ncbi:hypothetical protein C4573_01800 [Candidatus Woesearchaeota archaeon]|nr:MAG: hypothetical protein C4573_01800 [Candidatus Woesearchaeota archaeon]
MSRQFFVAFISKKLKDDFEELQNGTFQDRQLYKAIVKVQDALKQNPLSGIKIPQKLWPKEYIQKYHINNLWKYDLRSGWRLLYTIESDEIKIVSIILEWFNHKNYERKFHYT